MDSINKQLISCIKSSPEAINILIDELINSSNISNEILIVLMEEFGIVYIKQLLENNKQNLDTTFILYHYLIQMKGDDEEFMGMLIDNGADINYDNGKILYKLSDPNYISKSVETVLKLGANPNLVGKCVCMDYNNNHCKKHCKGRSNPLIYVSQYSDEESYKKIKLLLKYGAEFNHTNFRGNSAIDYCNLGSEPVRNIEFLLENGHLLIHDNNYCYNTKKLINYLNSIEIQFGNFQFFKEYVISTNINLLNLIKTMVLHIKEHLPEILMMIETYHFNLLDKFIEFYSIPFLYMNHSSLDNIGKYDQNITDHILTLHDSKVFRDIKFKEYYLMICNQWVNKYPEYFDIHTWKIVSSRTNKGINDKRCQTMQLRSFDLCYRKVLDYDDLLDLDNKNDIKEDPDYDDLPDLVTISNIEENPDYDDLPDLEPANDIEENPDYDDLPDLEPTSDIKENPDYDGLPDLEPANDAEEDKKEEKEDIDEGKEDKSEENKNEENKDLNICAKCGEECDSDRTLIIPYEGEYIHYNCLAKYLNNQEKQN